ncbi:MAG: NfeD family protein [Spirochaetales bacterium]
MTDINIWIWVAVIAISLIVEALSMDMTSIWFSVGGFVALILTAMSVSVDWQVIVFVLISGTLLLTLKKWAKNKLLTSKESTNMDLIKEKKFKLLTAITESEKGTLKYNDVIWNATSSDSAPIKEGEWVDVVEVKGNTLIVKKEGK